MVLTDSQKAGLQGEQGQAVRLAMELLTGLGDSLGAERLIPIKSAHFLGHYGSLHQAGIDFLEQLIEGKGQCKVPTTVDPSSVDFERWEQFRIPREYADKQRRLREAVVKLGVIPSWSCTPYLQGNVPEFGWNVAWAESSAVAFANSAIGARTNRTPFGMDICAAITGLIPEFGLYLGANRRGAVLFVAEFDDWSDLDYHTFGSILGSRSGAHVPVVEGVPPGVTRDQIKCLGAAAASAGSVALVHIMGVTPEACRSDPFAGQKPLETFAITREDIKEMEAHISTANAQDPVDMVTLGCPLFSTEELDDLHRKMQGRKTKKDIHFWVYLTREAYDQGKSKGFVGYLERAGIWFSTQSCATISPVKVWGFSHVMTNSAKCALVVPSEHGVKVTYGSTEACILAATERA